MITKIYSSTIDSLGKDNEYYRCYYDSLMLMHWDFIYRYDRSPELTKRIEQYTAKNPVQFDPLYENYTALSYYATYYFISDWELYEEVKAFRLKFFKTGFPALTIDFNNVRINGEWGIVSIYRNDERICTRYFKLEQLKVLEKNPILRYRRDDI